MFKNIRIINKYMNLKNNFLRKIEVNIRSLILGLKNKEKNILRKICLGKGADIGCGSDKVCEEAIGVDLFVKGERGKYGSQRNKVSVAEIKASGDKLPFKNSELDYIVAKHNLEHYEDPKKTIKEWKRVLRVNGRIGVVVPDDKFVDTFKLDPTHKCKFDLQSLENLFKNNGFLIIEKGSALKHWSIYLIAKKIKK